MKKSTVKKLTKFLFLRIVGKPTTAQEIRMTFYRVIIMNMFWIDEDLPHSLEQKFKFFINPSWEESSIPQDTTGLKHMSEAMLTYLCNRLNRPNWTDNPNTRKFTLSLNEVVQHMPDLFELPDENPG